ncbi:MAG: transcription-repair coupling factor, partial [Chloroflexota bacterium]|nr:transcription-repair coupling factor [Chloroflexota bacterium]
MPATLNLIPLILKSRLLQQSLAGVLANEQVVTLPPAAAHARPAMWAAIFDEANRSTLVLVPRPEDSAATVETLSLYSSRPEDIVHWPSYDFLPYERGAVQAETTAARLAVLERLQSVGQGGTPVAVVASVRALCEPTLTAEYFRQNHVQIRVEDRLDLLATAQQLARMGYNAVPLVETPGSFSRRGGILDVWSPSGVGPVRLELFGDEVESIRTFDPATQRSEAALHEVVIVPPLELPLEQTSTALRALRELPLGDLRPEARTEWEQLLLEMDAGGLRPSYGGLAPYFPSGMGSLLEHLPANTLLASDDAQRLQLAADALHAHAQAERAELESTGELPTDVRRPYFLLSELEPQLAARQTLLPAEEVGDTPLFSSVTGFGGNVERMLRRMRQWIEEGRRVVLITQQANRVLHLLSEHEIPTLSTRARVSEPPAATVSVVPGSLPEGWISEELNAVLLGDGELWGYVEPRRNAPPRKRRVHTFLTDLEPGGLVVHVDHGIARYIGNVSRGAPGAEREYLLLEYASGDKLYVPVDQVDRISPYIGAGGDPALSRLGTTDWVRTKRRVKRAADDLAQELLKIYAARELSKGFSYSPDGPLQREFDDAFPYVETEDQLRAIADVKEDMESPRPMDRLVCGDVGYGKTEVAMRAAFKAMVDGKQVA